MANKKAKIIQMTFTNAEALELKNALDARMGELDSLFKTALKSDIDGMADMVVKTMNVVKEMRMRLDEQDSGNNSDVAF